MTADLERMSDLYDEYLFGLLKQGRQTQTDSGEMIQAELSASDLNVIRQRLKDCGVTALPTSSNPIGHIVEEMKKRGQSLPPIDDSDDAATA